MGEESLGKRRQKTAMPRLSGTEGLKIGAGYMQVLRWMPKWSWEMSRKIEAALME